jgi:hypothetical protein
MGMFLSKIIAWHVLISFVMYLHAITEIHLGQTKLQRAFWERLKGFRA